jgi:serine/threonine protein phosphatase 1
MHQRTFVIGDVHGCALTLQHLIFKEIKLRHTDRLYFTGDLIDRGPRSREVLETIIRLREAGYSVNSVRGNHEDMLLNACRNRNDFVLWLETGGQATLKSFAVEDACEIPTRYLQIMGGFPYYIMLEDFIICHAGLNFHAKEPLADTEAMLWSRDLEVIPERLGGRRLICGHTVHSLPEIRTSLTSNRIWLDGGCVFKERNWLGNLVALEIEMMKLHYAGNLES